MTVLLVTILLFTVSHDEHAPVLSNKTGKDINRILLNVLIYMRNLSGVSYSPYAVISVLGSMITNSGMKSVLILVKD